MAFSGNALCSTFKKELLEGTHNFANGGNSFKLALFTNSQAGNDNLGGTSTTMDATVTAYSSSAGNEVGNSGDYSAGGGALGSQAVVASTATTSVDFADVTWSSATFTAAFAAIYNDDQGDKLCVVLDFGGSKTATNGDFTISFPDPSTASNAIISLTS